MAGFWDQGDRSRALQFLQSYMNPEAGDVFWEAGDENKRPGQMKSAAEAIDLVSDKDELLKKMLQQMFLKENAPTAKGAESQYMDIASNDYRPNERLYQRWMRRAGL
jgi:hypothetical protein